MRNIIIKVLILFFSCSICAHEVNNSYMSLLEVLTNEVVSNYSSIHAITLDGYYFDEIAVPHSLTARSVNRSYDINFTLYDGTWISVDNGRLCTIRFLLQGANSMTLKLDNIRIADGSIIWLLKKDSISNSLKIKIPSSNNSQTIIEKVRGDEAFICLYEPYTQYGRSTINVSNIQGEYDASSIPNRTNSVASPCNSNVRCHPEYEDQSHAIVKIVPYPVDTSCSGSLITDASHSFTPYVLTAFHCIDLNDDEVLDANEIFFYEHGNFVFNYKSTYCVGTGTENSVTYTGCQLVAAWKDSDFALLKITDPAIYNNPYLMWMGWDRTGATPSCGVMLHHPQGDVMKISIDNNQLVSDSWKNWNDNKHWRAWFSTGIREDKSSGAPLLDGNKRIVGQLHGGQMYNDPCMQTISKFGKFSESWNGGGTSTTRLKDWLDPYNTNVVTTNSKRAYDKMYISGSTVPAANSQYSIGNLFPNCSVSWSYTANTGTLSFSQSGNTCTLSNASKEYVKGTLTANIYYGGTCIKTLTKTIDSAANFSGTYSQEGGQVISFMNGITYYDPIPTTYFGDGGYAEIHRQLTATITSPLFATSILERDNGNSFPATWHQSGNTITYNPPRNGPGIMFITGTGVNSYDVFKFTVGLAPEPLIEGLNLGLQSGNGTLTLTLVNAVAESEEGRSDVSGKNDLSSDADLEAYASSIVWHVIISNIQTGDIVFNGNVTGQTPTISTAGWPAGIYAVHAEVEGIQLSGKIAIR